MFHTIKNKDSKLLWDNQDKLVKTFSPDICIGVDEVGRGSLAGPVLACAMAFPNNIKNLNVCDSKDITEKKRKEIFDEILINNPFLGLGIVPPNIIDKINILNATKLAMKKAILECIKAINIVLFYKDPLVLIDGNFILKDIKYKQIAVIDGDSRVAVIASASIIAKVIRDEIMRVLDEIYPSYLFAKNKGYGTKEHIFAISKFGFSSLHRLTFSIK